MKYVCLIFLLILSGYASENSIAVAIQENSKAEKFRIPEHGLAEDDFIFGTGTNDPNLPRYLCIGDSVSSNYGRAIIDIHAGKLNAHHPPTNCGSSSNGRAELSKWLGDYSKPGQQWEVISFNFGHWDANETKADYQGNLRAIIAELKKTKAKLVWVTTCPVPNGIEKAEILTSSGAAPGRKSGVMLKFLNPWALEVIFEYPEISICDQWQFVYEHQDGLYKDWWKGSDVHFVDGPAYAIGRLLANHVLERVGLFRTPGFKPPKEIVAVSPGELPTWQPHQYATPKFGKYYSDAATETALPPRWRTAIRLSNGFPKDFEVILRERIYDQQGWSYELNDIANHLQLKAIKDSRRKGFGLRWYTVPDHVRSSAGPGLTGDEFLTNCESKTIPVGVSPQSIIEDLVYENVSDYYDLYRITRDRYYSDQIVNYGRGMQVHQQQPGWIDKDPALAVWAQLNAARLLLEQVRVDRADASDERVATAKELLIPSVRLLSRQLHDTYQRPIQRAETIEPRPFKPNQNSFWLENERSVPGPVALEIACNDWSVTIRKMAMLVAATRALEELQGIEKKIDNQDSINDFRRTVAAALDLFQKQNDCVVSAKQPFFYHSKSPIPTDEITNRAGHPLFSGVSIETASNIVRDLTYIWEANETFGCSTGLVVGYANAIQDQLAFPTGLKSLNHLYPRGQLDSPWCIAATGETGSTANTLAGRALYMSAFTSDLLKSHQLWTPRRATDEDVQLLKAATLYREWLRRRKRSNKER